MSATHIYRTFREAYVKAIMTLSLDTTPEYVYPIGSRALYISKTTRLFLVK